MKKLIAILSVLLLMGCTTVKYVEVPVHHHHTDSIVHTEYLHTKDTVYQRETIYQKGDTVYKDKYVYVGKESNKAQRDTIIKRDSIPVPYPVEVPVEVVKYRSNGWGVLGWVLLVISIGGFLYSKLKGVRDALR